MDAFLAKSGLLRLYMSSQPDTLVAFVNHHGGVKDKIQHAAMQSINEQVSK